ncbi:WD repeat-containing protein 53, partial [Nowakowskiella sp. JEL0078]
MSEKCTDNSFDFDSYLDSDKSEYIFQKNEQKFLASGDEFGVDSMFRLQLIMSLSFLSNTTLIYPLLYVAVGLEVLAYDLNCEQLVISTPAKRYKVSLDEINTISISESGKYLGVADDSGSVIVIDLESDDQIFNQLGHDNLCTCIEFRSGRPNEVITGSMDKDIKLWDFVNGKLLEHFDTTSQLGSLQSSTSMNPPFVTSLDVHKDGNIIAAGLGDGSILIFQYLRQKSSKKSYKPTKGCKKVDRRMLSGGFDSDLKVWRWFKIEASTLLISAGLDGRIALWDISGSIDVIKMDDQVTFLSSNPPPNFLSLSQKKQENLDKQRNEPGLISCLETKKKINCVVAYNYSPNVVEVFATGSSNLQKDP